MLVIGLFETTPMVLMRVPVISTRSVVCANAGSAPAANTPPTAASTALLIFVILNMNINSSGKQ